MSREPARADGGTLRDHLRRAHLAAATGRLEYEIGGRLAQLFVRRGEIWLAPENPSAGEIRALAGNSADPRWSGLLDRLATRLVESGSPRNVAFRQGDAELARSVVGPVPTAALLRRAARLVAEEGEEVAPDQDAFESPWVADSRLGDTSSSEAHWSPEEAWVLERLRQPMRLGELATSCPFPGRALALTLVGLREVGAVRAVSKPATVAADSGLLRLGELLDARIADSLLARPLTVPDSELRQRVQALAARWPSLDHYALLGVAASASESEIQQAFENLARQVHPSHADRIGGGELGTSLVILFERAVAAYRTLSDPALRVAYNAAHEIVPDVDGQDEDARRREAAGMARDEFERARWEELNGDLHTALSLYEQAAEIDPRAEYLCALAALQAKNKAWSTRAIETYRHALELDPQSSEIRFALGELHERTGDVERARSFYQAALGGRPPHAGARDALRRLGSGRGDEGEGGPLSRFFRRG